MCSARNHHHDRHPRNHYDGHYDEVQWATHHMPEHPKSGALGHQGHAAPGALSRVWLTNVGMHGTDVGLPARLLLIHAAFQV
jgi:hypothetical protein